MTCEGCGVSRSDIQDGCCTRPSCMRTVLVALRADRDRLKAGHWTPEEVNDLCHNLHGVVDAEGFAAGCAAEQMKLYGCAPDRDKLKHLASAMQKVLPAPLLQEVIGYFDPLSPFVAFLREHE